MNGRTPDPLHPMRLRAHGWEAFHCPIPLAWMDETTARHHEETAVRRVVDAGADIERAKAARDARAYGLAHQELRWALALCGEFYVHPDQEASP